jgi:hypothetical protein
VIVIVIVSRGIKNEYRSEGVRRKMNEEEEDD